MWNLNNVSEVILPDSNFSRKVVWERCIVEGRKVSRGRCPYAYRDCTVRYTRVGINVCEDFLKVDDDWSRRACALTRSVFSERDIILLSLFAMRTADPRMDVNYNASMSWDELRQRQSIVVGSSSTDDAAMMSPSGRWYPTWCIARHRVAIVVPFSGDRKQHLIMFLDNIHPFLRRQLLDYTIIVVEQVHPSLKLFLE